jgi:hypothetical protein
MSINRNLQLSDSPPGLIASKKAQRPISAINRQHTHQPPFEDYDATLSNQVNLNPYIPPLNKKLQMSSNDFMNSSYRKKLIPQTMIYKKEDLYEQNLWLKLQVNDLREENVRLKTRIAQLVSSLKGRDRLFDDLYRSAFITS